MTSKTAWLDVSERERQLLLHVLRYWLTTVNVVGQWLWPELSHDAVRKAMVRLVEKRWLARHLLGGQEPYFVLGPSALTALEVRRSSAPLGHQALLDHYGVLLACARRKCDVFAEGEFRTQFPELTQPGFSAKQFFLDGSTTPPRLGSFIVDHDKRTSRMVNKLRQRAAKLMETDRPKLRQMVLAGGLAFHIITATEGKRANLEAAFGRKPVEHIPVLVESFPNELGGFFLLNRR
jgi:hypothetical protein